MFKVDLSTLVTQVVMDTFAEAVIEVLTRPEEEDGYGHVPNAEQVREFVKHVMSDPERLADVFDADSLARFSKPIDDDES